VEIDVEKNDVGFGSRDALQVTLFDALWDDAESFIFCEELAKRFAE
jgi:hypothetical protein